MHKNEFLIANSQFNSASNMLAVGEVVNDNGNIYIKLLDDSVPYKVKVEESLHEKSYSLTNNKKKGFKIKFFNKEFLFSQPKNKICLYMFI